MNVSQDQITEIGGTNPKNFNVPEGSYSTNPYNPITRIVELREMIMKFHEKGIRVVMDMVYNHMMETMNMDNIVPGYYLAILDFWYFSDGTALLLPESCSLPKIHNILLLLQ